MLVRRSGLPWTTWSIHGIVRLWLRDNDCPQATRWPHYFIVDEAIAKRFAKENGLTLGPDPADGRPGKPAGPEVPKGPWTGKVPTWPRSSR